MPQMMPINWILSFIFFSMIFFLFNIMHYYIFSTPPNKFKIKKIYKKNLIWKW